MKKITRDNLFNLICKNKNNIFSVVFLKKDGSIRRMLCRFGVKKHLKGGSLKFDPIKKGLLVVFDMQKKGYRMLNLKTISYINMKGVEYNVQD
tara:strand:- start:187 stop:465 length:279 start_codon:yes stop_codon:yes gene_type:complete